MSGKKYSMLRFLYTLCEVLAAISAILSPVAILHWLGKIVNIPAVAEVLTPLNPVFDPLNAFIEFFIKTPALNYAGHSYSTTQGVVACVLTGLFFLLNFASETLKAQEQRLDVAKQSLQQKMRLQKLRGEQQRLQKKVVTNSRMYVYVGYDFEACPMGAGYVETAFTKYGGNRLEAYGNTLSLAFDSVDKALQYCMEVSQAVLSHYATLRPIDPQPPFKIGIAAVDASLSSDEGVAEARKLIKYAGFNHVIFSHSVRELLEAKGLALQYRYQSIGIYEFGGDAQQQELFRLFSIQPSTSL